MVAVSELAVAPPGNTWKSQDLALQLLSACAPAAGAGGRGGRSPGPGAAPRGRGGEKDGPCAASGSAMPGGFPGNVVFMICDDVMCVLVMLCACSRISWWRGVHTCNASKISLWRCVHGVLVRLCACSVSRIC